MSSVICPVKFLLKNLNTIQKVTNENVTLKTNSSMKAYTDLEQSKTLSNILPIESADMTLPLRYTQKDEYIPGYVVSRNYIDVYNEMLALPGMDKEEVHKLIQPVWSLVALLGVLPDEVGDNHYLTLDKEGKEYCCCYEDINGNSFKHTFADNPVDACVAMIEKLHELKML